MSYEFSAFKLSKLNGYAEIQPGFAFKSDKFIEDPSQTPLVKGENVQQGFIDWQASRYWNAEEYDALNKYHLNSGDIVLAMDRPWVTAGLKWSYIKEHDPKALLVQRVSRLRAKKGLDQTYLRCLISSSYFTAYIQPIVTGVNVPHISGKQIGDFKIPLPNMDEQRKIAAFLSAYDDLIENNKRRIALLENMAEEIYREWFVRFRFPSYKNAEFEKGIPKGWHYKKLNDLCELIKRGISPKYSDETDSIVINQKCIRDGRIDLSLARLHDSKVSDEKYIQYADVLINSTGVGTLGRVAVVEFNPDEITVDSHVTICRSDKRKINPEYLAATVAKLQGYFEFMASGSTGQVELNKSLISSIKILVPPDELMREFSKQFAVIAEQKQALLSINQNLTLTRGQLLPRLIAGKLSVKNLNIQFPPSMQEESAA